MQTAFMLVYKKKYVGKLVFEFQLSMKLGILK